MPKPKSRQAGKITRNKILVQMYLYERDIGYQPTHREIMSQCEINSTSVVSYHLKVLKRQGLINTGPLGSVRTNTLTAEGRERAKSLYESTSWDLSNDD